MLTQDQITAMTLEECLLFMRKHGSSVLLNWSDGEDGDCFECSWITSGKRITCYAKFPRIAARLVLRRASGIPEPTEAERMRQTEEEFRARRREAFDRDVEIASTFGSGLLSAEE